MPVANLSRWVSAGSEFPASSAEAGAGLRAGAGWFCCFYARVEEKVGSPLQWVHLAGAAVGQRTRTGLEVKMNMNRTWRWTGAPTLLFWALVLWVRPAFAGRTSAESIQVEFDPSLVRFEAVGEFERVFMPGMEVISEPGEPSVPAKVVRALIPGAWSKVRVTAIVEDYADLGVGHRILPRQRPQVLSIAGRRTKAAPLAAGRAEIYGTDKPRSLI